MVRCSVFHHVLAVETVKVVTCRKSQKSHCENVLHKSANYGIDYMYLRMILICVVNIECTALERVTPCQWNCAWTTYCRGQQSRCFLSVCYHAHISNRATVGAIVDEGLILTDNKDKSNAFNEYFFSVGVADNKSISHCRDLQLTDVLDSVTFTEVEVANSIDRLKCNLSSNLEGLPQCY